VAQRRPDRLRGSVHDEFWSWCDREELRLQQCERCNRICWPPVQVCEYCGGTGLSWQRMSGKGRLVSWCTFERDYYAGMLPMPWDTILVELAEGVLFISNPVDFGRQDMTPALPLTVTFINCEDSGGPFKLPVFSCR
jgi:uncharacterized protein